MKSGLTGQKIGIVTQARMSSTRLPGKINLPADGITLLEHHLRRLKSANLPIYAAIAEDGQENVIAEICKKLSVPYHIGSLTDVLDRFYQLARRENLDTLVRVTSDCPLIDGTWIQKGLSAYLEATDERTYLSNAVCRTFPRGLDFEIFSFKLLRTAWENAKAEHDREHVTPYIREKLSVDHQCHFTNERNFSNWRICVDEFDDYKLVKLLIEDLGAHKFFGEEFLNLLEKNPELSATNRHVEQKKA